MVTVVHTADVHLAAGAPERRDALAAVLDLAAETGADAVTIGGDCFDDPVAAERLRGDLRSLFADRPFPVVAIPGNHDREAFRGDAFFGAALHAATAEPFEHVPVAEGAARLTCVPYTPTADEELLVALREREPFDGPEALVLHCSLEAPVADAAGAEDATRYCPVTRGELAALGFDVVLAGHYHQPSRVALPAPGESGAAGATFVYPGTPASVTRAETGRRRVAVVEVGADGGDSTAPTSAVDLRPIETSHHDELSLTVAPGEESRALERIREAVAAWTDRDVDARIEVEGFVEADEAAFAEALASASGDVALENRTRSVERLLAHPLYREFEERLDPETALDAARRDDYDPERFAGDVREAVLAAMAELDAAGELT